MFPAELEQFIEQYHRATGAFINGDPEPQKALFSHREDVTLANPLGPPARGWKQVEQTLERAAAQIRGGEPSRFERISGDASGDLGYILEFERTRAKLGGSDQSAAISLRVTTVFRREDGAWKIVHRHADPITAPQTIESVISRTDGSRDQPL